MKFYLIAPGERKSGSAEDFFWMQDNGEYWIHIVKGEWRKKHPGDQIVECSLTDEVTDLDWSKTPLYGDGYTSGWLCRSGRFYGCPPYHHDKLAAYVLSTKVPDLERMGWVRVYGQRYYTCETRLSEEQKNWLSQNGHKVYDTW